MPENTTDRVLRELTGRVADGAALRTEYDGGRLRCVHCRTTLNANDEVVVVVRKHYPERWDGEFPKDDTEGWEPSGVWCPEHAPEGLDDRRCPRDDYVVVSATLEPTGYHDAYGIYHADELTFGGLSVEEISLAPDDDE